MFALNKGKKFRRDFKIFGVHLVSLSGLTHIAMEHKHAKESRAVRFFRKRRVSVMNANDRTEEWYVHISPAGAVAASVAVLLVVFVAVSILVSYTPLLEFIPGYRAIANRSREGLIANIMRMDSMERQMRDMLTYNQNIALIMDGKMPVARTIVTGDSVRIDKTLVMPSPGDSLLRAQMEGDGPYSLHQTAARGGEMPMELTAPVAGVVASQFSIVEGRFGIIIAAAPGAQISATADGTVILSSWSPENGYMVAVQHDRNNIVSIYKSLASTAVTAGQRVAAGDPVGYNAEGAAETEHTTSEIEFELWDEGKPADPENYIIF